MKKVERISMKKRNCALEMLVEGTPATMKPDSENDDPWSQFLGPVGSSKPGEHHVSCTCFKGVVPATPETPARNSGIVLASQTLQLIRTHFVTFASSLAHPGRMET
eukprot:TRINITY_DN92430_c0_g1_i1.p1 TRINITY_DN92430_c0_g1~~TRINITY_DN92430_c0_g1_i1.p1  ORF type:complete len:106 (+),score=4.81 TRINITY_DN92430_c0_g1_i1:222-539(+)